MELVNPDQLHCSTCHHEVFETDGGWVHRDGSDVQECAGSVVELVGAVS